MNFDLNFSRLESRPKSSTPRRDLMFRNRDFKQKVETRPRLESAETEMRHDTFEITYLLNITNIFNIKFWTMGILMNFRTCCNSSDLFICCYLQFVCFSFGIKKLIVQKKFFGLKNKNQIHYFIAY